MKSVLKVVAVLALSASIFACSPKQQSETEQATDSLQVANAYVGTFVGELPCADCPGINVELTLNEDGTFAQKEVYQGTDSVFETSGSFYLSPKGDCLITVKKQEPISSYKIMEQGGLKVLDAEGQEITGELAAKYVLNRK